LDDVQQMVRLSLHLGAGVHVRDDGRAGVLRLPRAELVGVDRSGERAAGLEARQQNRLVGDKACRLGHEVDPAEDDRRRAGVGGDPRQRERVATWCATSWIHGT
jgi:hypothetical protein